MLEYTNIVRYDDLPFEDYLKLKGKSFSFLKGAKDGVAKVIKMTDKIRLGSIVDSIMTGDVSPEEYSSELYKPALSISKKLDESFGDMIKYFEKQVSYTAHIKSGLLYMPTTGRLDFLLPKIAVIDLKVNHSAKDLKGCMDVIDWMGYKRQVYHYSRLANVGKRYIMMYSTKVNDSFIIKIESDESRWWTERVLEYGEVITE